MGKYLSVNREAGLFVLGLLVTVVVLSIVINVFDWRTGTLYGAGTTQTASSTVIVGNAAPTVTSVILNINSEIVLTANATTAVTVSAIISDNNGCADITGAGASTTILVYRSGVTSSTCLTTQDNQNCYLATAFTASSTCSGNSVNATATLGIYYFAQPTDASSSLFTAQNWLATVIFKDTNNSTGSGDPSLGVDVRSLTAINVTTSSINYGTLSASSTSAANVVTTSTNAGNTSTTLSLSANATLTKGSDSISTSSQHYATSSFTYGGAEQPLLVTVTHVAGSIMVPPTSTTNVNRPIFWALNVPAGTATGTYNGVTLFTAAYTTSSPL